MADIKNSRYETSWTNTMYTSPGTRSANAYAQHGAATRVATASPHELISLLFDAIDEQIAVAVGALKNGDAERRGAAVNRAILLLQEGLRGGLDVQNGGDLAYQLDQLYQYCTARLGEAQSKRDGAMFEEVRQHLRTVADGWKAIRPE